MYPDGLSGVLVALGLFNLIWIIVVTVLVLQERAWIKKLFPKRNGDLKLRFGEALKAIEDLEHFKQQFLGSVQKITLKRYNPYRDTGGDQSFSIALLDGRGDGVVITSLHSRAGTRVFAKTIKGGKEDKFSLSAEEQQVVMDATVL